MTYLVLKALHIIAVVCWFAGLFYLPRLMVYAAETNDKNTDALLITMQHKLLNYITTPSAVATFGFGLFLIMENAGTYSDALWLHVKLLLVLVLIVYHAGLYHFHHAFKAGRNTRSSRFFRIYNEIPTLILIAVVFLAVVKPF